MPGRWEDEALAAHHLRQNDSVQQTATAESGSSLRKVPWRSSQLEAGSRPQPPEGTAGSLSGWSGPADRSVTPLVLTKSGFSGTRQTSNQDFLHKINVLDYTDSYLVTKGRLVVPLIRMASNMIVCFQTDISLYSLQQLWISLWARGCSAGKVGGAGSSGSSCGKGAAGKALTQWR